MSSLPKSLLQAISRPRAGDHNDLYHVIQMGALYCIYRAGALVRDQDPQVLDFEATQPLPLVGEE